MHLTRLAVFRPVIALTVTLALLMFGVLSYFSLGLEDNPQLKLPIVTVTAVYPGASAETIEIQVTRRIEDAISSMGSIKTITSSSQTSVSQVVIEFTEGTNVDVAASDIQQKVSGIRRDLPAEVEEPSYVKLDLNDVPVVNLAVTSTGDADPTRLFRVADDIVRPRLEGVNGVGRVEVIGGAEPEVQVEVLPEKLRSYGLTLDDVTDAVRTQFMSTSGGQIKSGSGEGSRNTSMRIDSREANVASLANLPVASRDGVTTELRNVARVFLGGKEAETILRVNGKPAAGVLVYKQSDANITRTVDALLPRIEQVNTELPGGFSLELVIDQSRPVRETVDEVQHELLLAAIITGVVLFFFLHSLRSTVIVLLAIPSSLLVALIVMQVAGLTLNGMTLIALTTAIGVLVDDSIVVLENIFSKLEHGEEPKQAAVNGRSEIGMAAIAITMVDVAVWGPIIFMTGIVGAFLRNFAIVMVAATLASLLVSFTLTPLVASRWLSAGEEKRRGLLARFGRLFEPLYQRSETGYRHLLHWSLRHRPVVVVGALLIFSSNFFIVQALGSEFVPEGNREIVTVVGELPAGSALEATDRAAKRWEMQLLNHDLFPEVHTAFVQVGTNRETRTVSITLDVGEGSTRQRSSAEIGRAAVAVGQAVAPEMRARRSNGGGGNDQPVQVRVFGDDLTLLTAATNNAEAALRGLPELADVTNSLTAAPEVTIRPDAQRLMDLGANTQQIGTAVRVAYQGAVVGKWAEANGKERDVRVVVPADIRNRPDAVASLPLFKRGPQLITLNQVATATTELKPTKISRVNRQRVATLGAEPVTGVPLGTAVEEVTATMNGLALPPATHWELAGTSQDQVDSFAKLLIGLGLSIVLMYMVLTVLYESWLQPILILSALPLATVGAFLGLLVFGQTLNVPSFIGIIALFGLVGKNAILLVDRTNDLRRHHRLDRTAALEQSGPSRLRPILMTSAVLILSMLPVSLEIGGSGSGRAPLGAVLVGGMFTSTFLSLLYVPVAYTYFDSFGTLMGRLFGWRPGRRSGAEAPDRATVEPAVEQSIAVPAVAESVAEPPVPIATTIAAEARALASIAGPIPASTLVMAPGTSQIIKLLVVDDVPSVRRGLRMRLSLESDLQVVGEAASGEEALAVVRELEPDVILMDIEMPGLDGLVTTAAMRTVAPTTAIVTLSMHDDQASREKALAAGATAFVGKSAASNDLLNAIRDAASSAA